MAKFEVRETREALSRPGAASRGEAFKTREGRKKREFFAARGARRGSSRSPQAALMADRKHAWSPAEAWGRQGEA